MCPEFISNYTLNALNLALQNFNKRLRGIPRIKEQNMEKSSLWTRHLCYEYLHY